MVIKKELKLLYHFIMILKLKLSVKRLKKILPWKVFMMLWGFKKLKLR